MHAAIATDRSSVLESLRSSVLESLRSSVPESLRTAVGAPLRKESYGTLASLVVATVLGQLSFVDFVTGASLRAELLIPSET